MDQNTPQPQGSNVSNGRRVHNRLAPGLILVLLGVVFLLNNYGLISIDLGKLWPVVLIVLGLGAMFGYRKH